MNTAQSTMGQHPPTSIPQIVNSFWRLYSQNINSGAWIDIEMPIGLKSVIGVDGVETLATRFRSLIQAPVTTSEDPASGVIRIAPSRNHIGHDIITPGAPNLKVKATMKAKVARPPNAFILYRQHHHPLIKAKYPDIHNNQISVILGTQWKNEAEDTKSQFITLAKQLKAKHLLEYPNYKYQPRKPGEKKRRMTRRKVAALTNGIHSQSSSSAKSAIMVAKTPYAGDETSATPDLPKTLAGNVTLGLGDEHLEDDDLSAMLEQHNQTLPQVNNPFGAILTNLQPPVLYDEPTEEAQNDRNFYSSLYDFDSFMSDKELAAELDAMTEDEEVVDAMGTVLSPSAQKTRFDKQNESFFDAELVRMSTIE